MSKTNEDLKRQPDTQTRPKLKLRQSTKCNVSGVSKTCPFAFKRCSFVNKIITIDKPEPLRYVLKETSFSVLTMRMWMRLPVYEFHTFRVRLLAAVITMLSWRFQATMVTLSLVTLSSKGGGLYFLKE